MLNIEQTQILEQAIFLLFRLRNEQSIENWEVKRAQQFGELYRPIFKEEHEQTKFNVNGQENEEGFLKFTEKEILKMPTRFRKTFRANGCLVHVRRRKRGNFGYNYEARYRRDGFNISVSSKEYDKLNSLFIEKLNVWEMENAAVAENSSLTNVPTTFAEFAEHYLNTFWRRTVDERTFRNEMNRYKNHIKPFFGSTPLKKITPAACQNLLDKITEAGLGKTADEVHTRLNMIFEAAKEYALILKNPLKLVVHIEHERKTGVALTYEEESFLLNITSGTVWQLMFAVAIYTGLRPNEFKSAHIEGKFIVSIKSKQRRKKGRKIEEYKKIPITPMLAPYLAGVSELRFYVPQRIREKLRKLLPGHTLKDLRKTFNTRCVECKVDYIARKLFMGHSLGKLDDTYTQTSDDYLLKEGEKIKYDLPPKLPPDLE